MQGCENKDDDLLEMVLGKLSTIEHHNAEQRSLNQNLQQQIISQQSTIKDSERIIEKLQHQMSSQQNEIQDLKKQLLSQQKYIEKIENSLLADEKTNCIEASVQRESNNSEPEVLSK